MSAKRPCLRVPAGSILLRRILEGTMFGTGEIFTTVDTTLECLRHDVHVLNSNLACSVPESPISRKSYFVVSERPGQKGS